MRLLAIATICCAFVASQVAAQDAAMLKQLMDFMKLQQQMKQFQGTPNQNNNANTATNTQSNTQYPVHPSRWNFRQTAPNPPPPNTQNQYQPPPPSNTWNYNTQSQYRPPQRSAYYAPNTPNLPAPRNPNINIAPYQHYPAPNPPQAVILQPPSNLAPNNPTPNVVNKYQEINLKTPNSCAQFTQGRVYCTGTNKASCEAKGCCWDPTQANLLTCFYHLGMANLPPPTAPPSPPLSGMPTQLSPSFVPPSASFPQRIIEPSRVFFTRGCLLHCTSVRRAERSVCIPNAGKRICTQGGCCFDESEPDVYKRCFHSNYIKDACPLKEECKLPHIPVRACGRPQITKSECEAMGCCHNAISGVTMCYTKQYRNQPPPPTPKPNKIETTTKFNLLQKLKELEAEVKSENATTATQLPRRPTIEPYEVSPKAAGPGFASNLERGIPSQAPPTFRPPFTPPPTPPVQYRQQCFNGICNLVPIPPPMCIPRRCGDPTYTPNKVKHNFDPRKIVGGSRAFPFSHPWTVMIQKTEGNRTFICGASLICQQWIVTAAHCLDQQSKYKSTPDLDANAYKIFLGRWAGWQSSPGRQVQVFKGVRDIEMMFQHEQFIPGKHRGVITHDIALIKLRRLVRLDDFVQPACFPIEPPKPGNVMFATGWGVSKDKGPTATTLKQVGVEIKTQQTCKDRVPGFKNPPGVICGGGEPDHDTCTGDSGGPLVAFTSQRTENGATTSPVWYLHGLTSIGSPSCNTNQFDRQPALYTDVFYFLDWIKTHTNNCCR